MYVGLVEPLKTAAKIRVTYNGKELFTREFAEGDTPELRFQTPAETGDAKAFLIVGEKETPIGMASYIYPDVAGAKIYIGEAKELSKAGKSWPARTKLLKAIKILEEVAPDSEEMAEAYLSMCWVYFGAKSRKHMLAKRQQEAAAWYEKAISVWERNGNTSKLSGNLTNISALYRRFGQFDVALQRAARGLKIERTRTDKDSESIGAWTHAAALYLIAGKLNTADRVINDGLKRFGSESNAGYLLALKADVLEARAKQFRDKGEAMLPKEACAI